MADEAFQKQLTLGKHYYETHRFKEARAIFGNLLSQEPHHVQCLHYRAACMLALGENYAVIKRVLGQILNDPLFGFPAHLLLAQAAYQRKQFEEAKELLDGTAEMRPNAYQVHASYARLYTLTRQFPEAHMELEKAKELEPQAPTVVWAEILLDAAQKNRHVDRQNRMEQIVDSNMPILQQLTAMTQVEWTKQNYKKALEYTRQAFLLDPTSPALAKDIDTLTTLCRWPNRLFRNRALRFLFSRKPSLYITITIFLAVILLLFIPSTATGILIGILLVLDILYAIFRTAFVRAWNKQMKGRRKRNG